MGGLSEQEIFECLRSNLKLAAEHSDLLATLPLKGQNYFKLRAELHLIEGAARQAAAWRGDSRWLYVAQMMSGCHQRAGGWLRGIPQPDGSKMKIAPGQLHPLFVKLSESLRTILQIAETMQSKATGVRGPILPETPEGPHRDTRPVGWTPSAGGILIPSAA